MANKITSNGSLTFSVGGLTVVGNQSNIWNLTGSNINANVVNIATGSWQPLPTSSLSDTRLIFIENQGSGSITIASGSAGGNVLSILQKDDFLIIPWSGSLTLYAQAYTSKSVAQVIVAES